MADIVDPLVARNEDFINGGFVVIVVSNMQRCFVHKSLLKRRAQRIEWFSSAVEDEYRLTWFDKETVELYIHYLYTGEIQCKKSTSGVIKDTDGQDDALVDLYYLAYTLRDDTAQHAVLSAFLTEAKRSHNAGESMAPSQLKLKDLIEKHGTGSPLRQLFIDMCVWDTPFDESLYKGLPEASLIGIMDAVFTRLRQEDTKSVIHKTCCDYDELKDGQQCRSKKRKRSADEDDD
ncbi:hypothetical protein AC578_4665 [Pseudocercospora eumusae]|uniref:BTB domain-containing protein n=1 Tax=Pseudocercospora eumusae TaxID=321146 RepID=A0A139H7F4_9PEZI|nr:hypothetical protein AC578_4665 [Pseudocercospora eumusae]